MGYETHYSAVDVGTTKVCAMVAKASSNGGLHVVALGQANSSGMKKGIVVSPEDLKTSVSMAVREAREMFGRPLPPTYVGVTGVQLLPQSVPSGRTAAALPQNAQQVVQVVEAAGVRVKGLAMQHLASSESVLTTDERRLGVVLVDIGGGTSDITIFKDGSVYHTASVPVAGNQFTSDVAIGLGMPFAVAEQAKLDYGSTMTDGLFSYQTVEMKIGPKSYVYCPLALNILLRDRAIELVRLIQRTAREAGLSRMPQAGLVLTGGSANLPGLAQSAMDYAYCPVRVGAPSKALGLPAGLQDASYATPVGLLLWAIKHQAASPSSHQRSQASGAIQRLLGWAARLPFRHPRATTGPVLTPALSARR